MYLIILFIYTDIKLMKENKKIRFILPVFTMFVPLLLFAPKAIAGSFGAEIFCTMRDGGNDHESSWQAAYSYIKKQKGGIFKTSPKQAAGQIIETVVRERDKFSYCVEFLDQLHPDRKPVSYTHLTLPTTPYV